MIPDFRENQTYDTSGGRTDFATKLFFGSRFNFFFRVYYNFFQLDLCIRRGHFNRNHQIFFSRKNADILERCGARIHVRGMEHLSAEPGPFILAGNHMSSIETMLLTAVVQPRLDFTFVIKQGLFSVPFLRRAMREMKAIGVGQVNPRDDFRVIMEEGEKRLLAGKSVLIFPEASRCPEFIPEHFNSIAVKLARKCSVKIIPFALKTDFLSFGKVIRECGPIHPERDIHIEFAPALAVTGNGKEEQRQITDFIAERSNYWKKGGTAK